MLHFPLDIEELERVSLIHYILPKARNVLAWLDLPSAHGVFLPRKRFQQGLHVFVHILWVGDAPGVSQFLRILVSFLTHQ